MIESIDEKKKTVSFRSRANNGKVDLFTVPDDKIWWQPHPHCPPSVRREVGDTGNLYLHRDAWDACAKLPNGGIYGYDPKNPNAGDKVLFKYPDCAFCDSVQALAITPTRVTVVSDRGERFELSDAAFAQRQRLVWNALSKISIATAKGDSIEVWPMQILVTGCPEMGTRGEVDILDAAYCDFTQTLEWTRFGEPLNLVLTPMGFYLFNTTF